RRPLTEALPPARCGGRDRLVTAPGHEQGLPTTPTCLPATARSFCHPGGWWWVGGLVGALSRPRWPASRCHARRCPMQPPSGYKNVIASPDLCDPVAAGL